MDTPFGLRRYLLLKFPEVSAATVSMPMPQSLVVRYVPGTDGSPDHGAVLVWVNKNRTAGVSASVERVTDIAARDLPVAQLLDTSIPLDVAEDAAININGLIDLLRRRWPNDFVRLGDGPGRVTCVVSAGTSAATQTEIQRELSLLLHGVAVAIQVDKTNTPRPHSTSRAELALADDWDRMYALCNDAVAGQHQPHALPSGAYAYLPLAPSSLFTHLAIASRVYVEVPRTIEAMQTRHGVSWVDFLDAMSTGRVIPVFRLPGRTYEPGMVDAALDAGGSCVLPGDSRLRELVAFGAQFPAVRLASQLDDRWRALHAAVRQHASGARFLPFFDAIAETAARARLVARRADFMAKTWAPIAFAIDDMLSALGRERRDLEFTGALDAMMAAQGCGTRPIVPHGDLIGQYLGLLFGSPPLPEKAREHALVEEPPVVARIVLERVGGISLRQFAESFDAAAIRAMQRLMESPRLEGTNLEQTVAEFEGEMHAFNGRRKKAGAASIGVDATIALAGLSAGWGLLAVAITVIAKHLISRSVLTDEQAARLVGSSKEAAYLARIDSAIKNR